MDIDIWHKASWQRAFVRSMIFFFNQSTFRPKKEGSSMRRLFVSRAATVLSIIAVFVAARPASATFTQGFETDTVGWFGVARVPSLTHGVPSAGGAHHAEDSGDPPNTSGDAFTRWGGYSQSFPPGGYITRVDIYLDISAPYMNGTGYANDTRFDWSSAISRPDCGHRRDFVFNAGFYNDTDSTGSGPRFVISASNNATRSGAFPKNPGRAPFTIVLEGWYTFEHRFYDSGGGVLAVDLTIRNSSGVPLKTWTLSDATDIIGSTVGGNRYGWVVINEFTFLALDNSALVGNQNFCTPPSSAGAKVTGGGSIPVTDGKATFGLTAMADAAGTPKGQFTYQDRVQNESVKSTSITAVVVEANNTCAQIFGTATVNGAGPFDFRLRVCDFGEPGKGSDTFEIIVTDGYTRGGTLSGGNIKIH
jgi:hypothetical protein